MDPILEIRDLSVEFATSRGTVKALRHIDLTVPAGRIVGVVGESGCGKTTLASTVLGLLANNGRVSSGSIRFEETELLGLPEARLRDIRGPRIAMVFQDPMTSLNPVMSIETQMIDIQYRDQPRARPSASAPSPCCARSASRIRSIASTNIRTASPAGCVSASPSPWRCR